MSAENNDKTRDDSQDFNKSKIELKKPISAGRYHEVLGELQKNRMLLAEYGLKFSKLFKSDLYSLLLGVIYRQSAIMSRQFTPSRMSEMSRIVNRASIKNL